MPKYSYTALGPDGKTRRGQAEAPGKAELQAMLKADGLSLTHARERREVTRKPLTDAQLAEFARQIGTLVGAGVPLVRALGIIAVEEGLRAGVREAYGELLRSVRVGMSLSDAMEAQGASFPPLMINMIRASEANGRLAQTATQMAEYYDKSRKLTQKVKTAMVYPKILAALILAVVIIIMTVVMPKFGDMFAALDELPLATRILFALSDLLTSYYLPLAVAIVIAVCLWRIIGSMPRVRFFADKIKVTIPVTGSLMRAIYTARFARTLSSLYSCGVPITEALAVVRGTLGNEYIASQFDTMISRIRAGETLSHAVGGVVGFSGKLSASILVGEESGDLGGLLGKLADSFDNDSESALNRLVSYVEPVMMIIMAVVVLFIMLGVIMPIYDSYGALADPGAKYGGF